MANQRFIDGDFRKASGSGDTGCVEVAMRDGHVGVRDSKDKGGPVLLFDDREWGAFVAGVKGDEFNISA